MSRKFSFHENEEIRNYTKKTLHLDSLSLNDQIGIIESKSIWGILRGLESFSQMLVLTEDRMTVRSYEAKVDCNRTLIHILLTVPR